MLNRMLTILLIVLSVQVVFAQYPVNWVNYDYINPSSDVTRGAVYNPHTDHVLVATRISGEDVIILDAASGDSVGVIPFGPVVVGADSTNTYALNNIAIADDGTIYVCNLISQFWTSGGTFKVYRIADEQSEPVLVFNQLLDGDRYGDAITAVGSGNNKFIYSSGTGDSDRNDKMVVLRDEGGLELILDSYITLPQAGFARHGISLEKLGGNIWINGAATGFPPPTVLTNDGTFIASCPDSIISPGGSSTVLFNKFAQFKMISVINAHNTHRVKSARVFENDLGSVTFGYLGLEYFNNPDDTTALYYYTGANYNQNCSGTLSYDSRRHSLIVVEGVNSIASISLDRIFKASTPRDSIWSVSIDGVNDFYPTDHVGSSNDRNMYLTWDDGKVFVGVTGQTLIDPTETNRMYLAFDLDPDGASGSSTPPENAGGVVSYPFNADVVIMVESWNEADYMIGLIYKWSGSAWTSSEYDGDIAAQGVLAFADEGEEKIAEVAAVRNAPGIGTDYTSINLLVYLAEQGSSGDVLAAFPDGNPTGNGVSLNEYFYTDSLGSGMFPTDPDHVQIRGRIEAIDDQSLINPKDFRLETNFPNPFNPMTTIRYHLQRAADIKLEIFNIRGQLIDVPVQKRQKAGSYNYRFMANQLSSGIYFYKLSADRQMIDVKKMVLLK